LCLDVGQKRLSRSWYLGFAPLSTRSRVVFMRAPYLPSRKGAVACPQSASPIVPFVQFHASARRDGIRSSSFHLEQSPAHLIKGCPCGVKSSFHIRESCIKGVLRTLLHGLNAVFIGERAGSAGVLYQVDDAGRLLDRIDVRLRDPSENVDLLLGLRDHIGY